MPWQVARSVNTVDKEILKFPAGLDAVESVVLQASTVSALASTVTGVVGKLGLRAGTILTKIPGDSKGRYRKYSGAPSEVVEGILGDNKFFYDQTDKSDEPADMLFHGCVFDASKIVDWGTYEVQVRAALNTCRFVED